MTFDRLLLLARTLPHLRPWQVIGRVVAPLRRRVTRLPEVPEELGGALRPHVPFPQHDPWNTRATLLEGRFCFLKEEARLGWPPRWDAAERSLLWRFNLHYFHYLPLLGPEEREEICRSWVKAHPDPSPVAWHPYPTSLRIVNWCRVGLEAPELQRSLYRQAAYLYRNLETHVYGNHLLENARALVLAGQFFGDRGEAPRWRARGLQLYRQEIEAQILPDGGHYERSPMYHALMLEGVLDVLNVLPDGHPVRAGLTGAAARMADFLASLRRPDGRLPLFNDATHEIAPAPETLLRYAEALTGHAPALQAAFPETGYFVHRGEGLYLAIAGGPRGPAHLLAHAHADLLSFELSLGGRPFVIDPGVYAYPAGPMRRYVRSTRAHSTVAVDGADQIECWDSFRVARRAWPRDVSFEREAGRSVFRAAFDGYARLLGDDITHRRHIDVDETECRLTVQDEVTGRGRHTVASRLPLHPDVDVHLDGRRATLTRDGVSCVAEAEEQAWTLEEGWYCPAFGVRRRNAVLALRAEGPLPVRLRYAVRWGL